MDNTEIEKIIDEVNGSMKIEDMELTEYDKDAMRRVLKKESTVEDEVEKLCKKLGIKIG